MHTRTLAHPETSGTGATLSYMYKTSCGNVYCKDGCRYHGWGDSMGKARADFGLKYDENFDEIALMKKPTEKKE